MTSNVAMNVNVIAFYALTKLAVVYIPIKLNGRITFADSYFYEKNAIKNCG